MTGFASPRDWSLIVGCQRRRVGAAADGWTSRRNDAHDHRCPGPERGSSRAGRVPLGWTPETRTSGAAVVAFDSMPRAPTATAVPLLRIVTPVSSPAPALVTMLQLVPFHCSTSVSSTVDMVSPTAKMSLAEEPEMANRSPARRRRPRSSSSR